MQGTPRWMRKLGSWRWSCTDSRMFRPARGRTPRSCPTLSAAPIPEIAARGGMPETTLELSGDASAALMSVVLATDTLETIRAVVRRLQQQTVRQRLEIVIVAPDIDAIAKDATQLDGFAAVRLVPVKSLRPFGSA